MSSYSFEINLTKTEELFSDEISVTDNKTSIKRLLMFMSCTVQC